MRLSREKILALPKIELHLHLDCSLSYDVVKQLDPGISYAEYQNLFIAPEKCRDLADFLKCTISGIRLMQTETALHAVITDLFKQLVKDNVIYAEIRFAPHQHMQKNLTLDKVVSIVSKSVAANAQRTGIQAGILLCTLRHYSEKQSLETVNLVHQFSGSNIVGFDIAANEAGFAIDAHRPAFDYAIDNEIPRTAHAGEAKGAESVWETLEHFQPHRLGHGVRSIEDAILVAHLIAQNIHLEVCPTCNVQTDIYEHYENHPVDDLFRAGISLGINTDARSLVNVSLTDEYVKLANTFGWGLDDFLKSNRNALSAAFVSDSVKKNLQKKLLQGYKKSDVF